MKTFTAVNFKDLQLGDKYVHNLNDLNVREATEYTLRLQSYSPVDKSIGKLVVWRIKGE